MKSPSPSSLRDIPSDPGCYLFYGEEDRLLYIGKARNLQKRVNSYFSRRDLDPKTAALVAKVARVETLVTHSEVEALILENSLIKRHQPHYNINLKDAKQYAYLQLTDEPFPRLILARTRLAAGKYFGPFVSSQTREDIHRRLVRIFRLRTCRRLPRRLRRSCLRLHLDLCTAPCIGRVEEGDYARQAAGVEAVLRGHTDEVLQSLQEEMRKQADGQNYERALQLRNQIAAIGRLKERQAVDRDRTWDEDFIHYLERDGRWYLMLFHARHGILAAKEEFVFEGGESPLEEFLARYYSEQPVPREIVLPRRPGPALQAYLCRERPVRFTVPQRGPKAQLLELVSQNILNTFFSGDRKLAELAKRLNLERPPEVVECFDVSHLSGTLIVASMVQFRQGRPDKRHYRRFRIRGQEGSDDCAAIGQVVGRRYDRLKREGAELPDLVVVDGGSTQLAAALAELKKLELTIPAIGIAKRLEEIYLPGYEAPLALPEKDPALILVREMRDEAHRFALGYHRLLRSKRLPKPKPARSRRPPSNA